MGAISSWKSRKQEDRDYVVVYTWGMLWCLTFLILTPVQVDSLFNRIVVLLWTMLGVVGGAIAVAGLMSRDNLLLERLGVRFIMIAPAAYAVTQFGVLLYELITTGTSQRFHLIPLGLWPFFFLRKRLHHLSGRVREAKATPLPGETT